ncbi:hypothetical protein [Streptomyces sp. NPDC088727]|uniref:hypothetical protein n=1 Tax=Streptomyces sp. NPDC088727 TaxID=3365875 RepID=UPI0037F333F2
MPGFDRSAARLRESGRPLAAAGPGLRRRIPRSSVPAVPSAVLLTRWARRQDTPEAYERALDAIAAELASSPLIDYQHRRTLLADWALPPQAWRQIADQLERRPSPRYISDDRARLAVTAYLWTQVTQGETQFAPKPTEARKDPELDASWRLDRFTIGHWLRQNKVPFYRQMKPLLDAYATQLARTVDAARSTRQLTHSLAN